MKEVRTISKFSQTIEYNIKTTLDGSGISKLQSEIRAVENEIAALGSKKLISQDQIESAQRQLRSLQQALNKSFNSNMGMLDTKKFTQALSDTHTSIQGLGRAFSLAGAKGDMAFNSLIGRLGKVNTSMNTVSKTTDKIFNTIGNTVRWGIIASGFQTITNQLGRSVQYMKDLDTSLTNIMMVTDYSRQAMNEYAKSANEAAKALGSTTVAMTDATLVFAQQGYDLPQSTQLAKMSTTLANVSQQNTATTSDQITAYMNAYGMDKDMDKLKGALDSWAEVANVSAADVQELATASQKAASTANTVGVNMDQLASQIATIESVTRDAPENIGNGLKTLYARFADIGMGETLEDGVDLGQVTGTLEKVGVQVLNSEDKMRNVGDIMEDLMEVWAELDSTQKNAIATTLAGKYQLTRFEALMNRSDLYEDYKAASENADGTMDKMQETYADSLAGRLNTLQASFEGLMGSLFDTSDFYGLVDAVSTLLDEFDKLIDAIGGSGAALTALGAIGTKVFNAQLSRGIEGVYNRFQSKRNSEDAAKQQLILEGLNTSQGRENSDLINFAANTFANKDLLTEEELRYRNEQLSVAVKLRNESIAAEELLEQKVNETNRAYALTDKSTNDVYRLQEVEGRRTGNVEFQADQKLSTISRAELLNSEKFKSLATNSYAAIKPLEQLLIKLDQVNVKNGKVDASAARMYRQFAKKEVIGNLREVMIALGKTGEEVDHIDSQLTEIMPKSLKDTKAIETAINNLIVKMKELASWTDNVKNNENMAFSQNFDNEAQRLQEAKQQYEASTAQRSELDESLSTRDKISSIISTTQAVSSLALTWQSFQSLGSIWENVDLTTGEKIEQSILNLAMTLPMLITGIQELGMSWKGSAAAQNLAAAATARTTAASNLAASSLTAQSIATRAAAVATSGLSKALSLVGGPIGAVILALGLASTAMGAFQQHIQDLKDEEQESASAARELVSGNEEAYNAWEELNKKYEDTGELSDEFKQKSAELAESLGIQGVKAYEAAGAYDSLATAIKSARDAQLEDSLEKNKRVLEGTTGDAINESTFFDPSAIQSYKNIRGTIVGAQGQMSRENADRWYNFYKNIEGGPEKIENFSDALADSNVKLAALEKELEEYSNHNADYFQMSTDDYEQYTEALRNSISEIQKWKEDSDVVAGQEALQGQAEVGTQLSVFQDNISQLRSAQEILNYFATDENTKDFFNSLATDADRLNYALQHVNDTLAQQKLLLEQSGNTFEENLLGVFSDAENTNVLANGGLFAGPTDLESFYSNNGPQQMIDYWREKIENSELTDEEKIQFYAELDMDKSLGEIAYQIEHIDADQLPKLNLGIDEDNSKFTDRFEETEDSLKELLSDSGLSEGAFGRMASDIFEDSFSGDEDRITREIEKINEAIDDGSKTSEDAQKEISALKEEYESLGDVSKDLAARNIRLNKGVSNLVKNWEDLGEILQDEASKGTSDYYEALAELDEMMSDILDIDTGTLSKDFYDSADALSAIEQAANGDMAAIDELRTLATKDIIVHMEIGGDNADVMREKLQTQLAEFQSIVDENSNIMITPEMDTSGFLETLNALLASCDITREQATSILSAIGMEGTITTETVEGKPAQKTIYHMRIGGSNSVSVPNLSAMMGDPLSANAAMQTVTFPEITIEPETVETNQKTTMEVPVIKGAKYSGPGMKNVGSVSRSGGRKGSSGGGGGKKGGSGGGSKYTPKKQDKIKEEVDRYEKVNTQLAAVGNDYEKIADEQERLSGNNLTDNMNKQIDLLQKQISLQKQKLDIQRQEAKELRDDLSKNYGVKFDSEGFITNYASTLKSLEGNVNDLINKYNSETSESGQEKLNEQIESAKERLEDFKNTYQRYDELISEDMKDSLKELEDLEDAIEDIRIEAFKTGVEAAESIKDVQEKLSEFNAVFSGRESDDPFREMVTSADKLGKYLDVDTQRLNEYYDAIIKNNQAIINNPTSSAGAKKWAQQQINQANAARGQVGNGSLEEYGTGYLDLELTNLQNILKEVEQFENSGYSDIFGKNSAEMYDTLKTVYESAAQMMLDFEGQIDELKDNILSAIDDIDERMQERLDQYEDITDELEHQAKIIEMVQGDRSYEQINAALVAQSKNYQQQIIEIQKNIKSWETLQKSMEEGSEEWKEVQTRITEGQQQINELIESNLENLNKIYENNVNSLLDRWTANTPLGSDLDWVEDQWELINRNADYYLDDVNAAYNIQKLQSKYLELLDGTNDLHIQQQITDQMSAQLGYLREKEKISEYDVAYAEAQLQILQKRIALEEAQRNKSQLKLKRDSQGNYSYVYTANQENIAGAENDLLDAQNNAYNLSKNQMKETQDDSLSALTDAKNMLNQIWNDANLTLAEKTERSKVIIDSLKEYLDGTKEQLSESEKNIINDFIGMVDLMVEENAERLENVYNELVQNNYDAFDQVDTRFSTSITEWLGNLDEFKTVSDNLTEDLKTNLVDWQDNVKGTAGLVNEDFTSMTDTINNTAEATDNLANSQQSFIQAIKDDIGIVSDYEGELQKYRAEITRLTNEMNGYKSKVQEAADKTTTEELKKAANKVTGTGNSGSGGSGSGGSGSGSGSSGGKYAGTSYSQGQLIEGIAGNIWTYGTWGNGNTRISRLKDKFGSQANTIYQGVQTLFNGKPAYGYSYNPKKWKTDGYGYYKKFSYSSFDTGGYTGTWSDTGQANNGKLAFLHQKELVLNSTDTKNMLAMVDAVRQTVSILKSDSLSSLLSKASAGFVGNSPQKLEQQVNIDATFPNVQDSNEIQNALLTLIDQAPQYIYKTK